MEPLIFRINAMSAVDTDFIMGSVLYPKDIPFYYGRLYAPDYSVVGDTMSATLYHEVYCKSCIKMVFTEAQNHESVDNVNCLCPKGKVFDFLVDSTLYIIFKRYYHDKDIVS